MYRRIITVLFVLASIPALASAQATPQKTPRKHHTAKHSWTETELRSMAKISEDSARRIALAQVSNGTVKSSELEHEKGTVVYSYDITVPGRTGVEEVLVSAIDGHVVEHQHETPKAERAEARKEAKEKKPTAAQKP